MPLWRKLHVKTVDSLDINDMPDDFTRLLWVLLPTQLDRCGRGIDNGAWVRSKVFPLREDVTNVMVESAMSWYARRGMIERYEDGDRPYFWIPTWHIYQGVTKKEAASNRPAPSAYLDPDPPRPKVAPGSRLGQDLGTTSATTDSDADSDIDSDVEEKETRSKEEISKEFFAAAFSAFQDTIGLVSGEHQRDAIIDILKELEANDAQTWWQSAINIAADQNKRSLAYVRGILRRCLAEGRPPVRQAIRPGKPEKRLVTVIDPDGQPRQVEATV